MNGNGNSSGNSGFEYLRRSIDEREIFVLFHNPFYNPESPLKWRSLSPASLNILSGSPFFSILEDLLAMINSEGDIKLTQRGYLPPKLCKDIYARRHLPDEFIDDGITKITTEKDVAFVHTARLVARIAGLIKVRKNILSLTRRGIDLLTPVQRFELFKTVFDAYTLEFNWGYNDGHPDAPTVQFGFGFPLLLLKVFGSEAREPKFYADLYRSSVPAVLGEFVDEGYWGTREENFMRCYVLRSFARFTHPFGLTEIAGEGSWFSAQNPLIRKSELFDAVVGERGEDEVS
jgi:hypothetical protein